MLNTKEKVPSNWHFTCQLTRIYRVYAHLSLTRNHDSDSYDKNDMKEKVNDLVRLHEAMQEELKTASFSEQIQIFTLVRDKWSQMYC